MNTNPFCIRFILVVFASLIAAYANAEVFRNAYVQFELPNNWECKLQETDWVCKSRNQSSVTDATIVLTAKEASPEDTAEQYRRHLSMPQNNAARGGGKSSIVQIPPKIIRIKGWDWIDSTHEDSEIKNYFTRYLATVKEQIAIAVTFSAHKDSFAKYSTEFFNAANSLEVLVKRNMVVPSQPVGHPSEVIGPVSLNHEQQQNLIIEPPHAEGGSGQKMKMIYFGIAVIVAAGALFFVLKNRK